MEIPDRSGDDGDTSTQCDADVTGEDDDSAEPSDEDSTEDSGTLTGSIDDVLALYEADAAERGRRTDDFLKARELGRALYRDAAGNAALRDSVCAFVDELGFSERVSALTDDELRHDLERYDAVRLNLSDPQRYWDDFRRVVYFSDNVGVAMPVNGDDYDGGLSMVLGVIADYQLELALGGRFVRGGVTRGAAYADHSFITGDALVRAVLLEKNHADVPRILIDPDCCQLAMNEIREFSDLGARSLMRQSDSNLLLLRDGDRVILNYLGAVFMDSGWRIEPCLEAHRNQVKHKLEQHANDKKLITKYQWVAEYHDFFVTQVAWYPEYLIGSEQRHSFASFSLEWLYADQGTSPIADDVLACFEHECAKIDVTQLTPLALHMAEADRVLSDWDRVIDSIVRTCEIVVMVDSEQLEDTIGPGIQQIVHDCHRITEAVIERTLNFSGSSREDLYELLLILDKGLRILRIDHRAAGVALQGLALTARFLGVEIDPRTREWAVPPETSAD